MALATWTDGPSLPTDRPEAIEIGCERVLWQSAFVLGI